MKRREPATPKKTRCSTCGQSVPNYDAVSVGSLESGYRELCNRCFNQEVAELDGLKGFAHSTFEPVRIADCTGQVHEFHFRTRLFGTGISLDAFELDRGEPSGYQFSIIGKPDDDQMMLLGRLIEKIRRALSTKHLAKRDLGLQIADGHQVRGRVTSDDAQDGRVPLLVIDGREVTWHELGRMVMSYEGWQFKLSLHDKSEEI